jgi:hypothetical protein
MTRLPELLEEAVGVVEPSFDVDALHRRAQQRRTRRRAGLAAASLGVVVATIGGVAWSQSDAPTTGKVETVATPASTAQNVQRCDRERVEQEILRLQNLAQRLEQELAAAAVGSPEAAQIERLLALTRTQIVEVAATCAPPDVPDCRPDHVQERHFALRARVKALRAALKEAPPGSPDAGVYKRAIDQTRQEITKLHATCASP